MTEIFYQKTHIKLIQLGAHLKQLDSLLLSYQIPEDFRQRIDKLIEAFNKFDSFYKADVLDIIKLYLREYPLDKDIKEEYLESVLKSIISLTESSEIVDKKIKERENEKIKYETQRKEKESRDAKKNEMASIKEKRERKLMETKLNVSIDSLGISEGVLKFLKEYEIKTCRDLIKNETALRGANISQEDIKHIRECISNNGLDDILLNQKLKRASI